MCTQAMRLLLMAQLAEKYGVSSDSKSEAKAKGGYFIPDVMHTRHATSIWDSRGFSNDPAWLLPVKKSYATPFIWYLASILKLLQALY